MDKKQLRSKYYKIRKGMKDEEVNQKSKIIADSIISSTWYKSAEALMIYVDFKNEVITKDFIKHALNNNKRVIIPVVDKTLDKLVLSELKNFEFELVPGYCGILEPKKEFVRIVDANIVDIIFVPGLVFDLRGYRIGYGGGYYDKLLAGDGIRAKTIGLAFDYQVIDIFPSEVYDKNVDMIITEKRRINTKL